MVCTKCGKKPYAIEKRSYTIYIDSSGAIVGIENGNRNFLCYGCYRNEVSGDLEDGNAKNI
jgi:hypothetical protein